MCCLIVYFYMFVVFTDGADEHMISCVVCFEDVSSLWI